MFLFLWLNIIIKKGRLILLGVDVGIEKWLLKEDKMLKC